MKMAKGKLVVRGPLDRPHLKTPSGGVSLTEQSHKDALCINRIMRTVERVGAIPPDPRGRVPNYGDVSHLNKPYDEVLTIARGAHERLVKYTAEQKEKIRLERVEKRKQIEKDAAAYRAHLAAVGKNNTTESQST
ncbi:VP3 [Trichosanthes kirilowii gokushovirus]|nr:VP3 [Trichosanthes kirilowii gokushovirus]